MIRLKRRFGSIPKCAVIDALCEQAERELVRIGAAEPVQVESPEPEQADLGSMTKQELLRLADTRGIAINPKATKADIIAALGCRK